MRDSPSGSSRAILALHEGSGPKEFGRGAPISWSRFLSHPRFTRLSAAIAQHKRGILAETQINLAVFDEDQGDVSLSKWCCE
jgi:hypothetical protein